MSENLDLARRAVACRGWRWMPGMLVRTSASAMRIDGADVDGRPVRREDEGEGGGNECYAGWRSQEVLPDFTDPATRGCLLQLVREAWEDPGISVRGMLQVDGDYHWYIVGGRAHGDVFYRQGTHGTEPAALVAALEAAPNV